MGRTNASVLPEPVGDSARTSRPASASGMTSDWTANGLVMPRRARAPAAADDTPRPANVGDDIWVLLLLCGAGDSTDPDHAGAHSKAQTSRAAAPPIQITLAAGVVRAAIFDKEVQPRGRQMCPCTDGASCFRSSPWPGRSPPPLPPRLPSPSSART